MALQNILLILFPGFNTLDMNGPYEILQKANDGNAFRITVASETDLTTAQEGAIVKRDIPLDDDLIANLHDYDILVVPGGTGDPVAAQAAKVDGPFMRLIAAYPKLGCSSAADRKILLSICTGAIFLGTMGVFNDRLCTTHWLSYEELKKRVQAAAAKTGHKPGTVVAARFVDSGVNAEGVHIISSGGVSCGMDASLYVIKLKFGEPAAKRVAELIDYAWRKTEGFVVLDQKTKDAQVSG
ncbi:DJ-1 PfpI family protein [Immersiella caudata]|uniref:DJ-1 PfpI family protein n=1 Tax=Immersiella caudata TaxID=314043 RepID=A0AA39WQ95_9PEZI|nr:DJ-1 PfpI family protein [Immersiella caudata]